LCDRRIVFTARYRLSLNTVCINLGTKRVNFMALLCVLSVCHVSFNISVIIRTSGHVLRIRRGSYALRKIRGVTCQAEELQCTLDSPSLDCSMLRFLRSLALQSVLSEDDFRIQ
jgi:hypothetical protein